MAEATFHARANAVRAESRMLMQKLRTERMATSRHRAGGASNAQAVKPTTRKAAGSKPVVRATITPPIAPPPAPAAIMPSRKVKAAMAPAEATIVRQARTVSQPEAAAHPPTPVSKAKRTTAAKAVTSTATPVAILEEVAKEPEARLQPKAKRKAVMAEAPVATQAKAEPASPPQTVVSPAPLSALPTLGPGMVWRLNQIGLSTVGDLAMASPDRLRDKLGAVAKLIRVESLIDLAQAHGTTRPAR